MISWGTVKTLTDPVESDLTHTGYEDDGVFDNVHHRELDWIRVYDLHRLGVRRLYCGPSRRMMRPRRIKLAATRGVGATMRATAL